VDPGLAGLGQARVRGEGTAGDQVPVVGRPHRPVEPVQGGRADPVQLQPGGILDPDGEQRPRRLLAELALERDQRSKRVAGVEPQRYDGTRVEPVGAGRQRDQAGAGHPEGGDRGDDGQPEPDPDQPTTAGPHRAPGAGSARGIGPDRPDQDQQ
jgi:hypothetical protein